MKWRTRVLALAAALVLALPLGGTAGAKTVAAGQTVDTVLFYIKNSAGEEILAAQVTVAEMEAGLAAGLVDSTNHNYSLLDRYVTTVHQEAQGFTVPEFVAYAQSKTTLDSVKNLRLAFAGSDRISFWEIDQTGFDELDTYSYDSLYSTPRYNFPLLYEYWDYRTQTYADPAGVMSKEEVIDYIFAHGEPETVLMSVLAFSQRYIVTDEKYGTGDYNMENLWQTSGVMDTQRTIRLMKPMTEEELRGQASTAADTRYWTANLLLDMEQRPELPSLGEVAAPEAVLREEGDFYYAAFTCATPGASILYNHNFLSPSYTPTCAYDGGEVAIPKSAFPGGTVTMTCRAVKEGYTDPGVTTLTLTVPGYQNPYSDVEDGQWYSAAVQYVTERGLFDPAGENLFGGDVPMTRLMLAEALYRLAGSPQAGDSPFPDCAAPAAAWAYASGVVTGMEDGSFAPGDPITREQIVTMFHRYAANVAGADMDPSAPLSGFTDAWAVADWAREQMEWAVAAKLMTGVTETELAPKGTATRAQAAALVLRLAGYMQ